jgi:small subunit ribosomal protein S6
VSQLKYDVIYILDPNSTVEEQTAVSTKVEQVVAESKGTVLKKEEWGKRRLAYTVQKHRDGHYVFFHVQVSTETVAELNRNLRLLEKVIKFMIVKDTISHLKPRPKPVRKAPEEGASVRPHAPTRHSGPSAPYSSSHSSSSTSSTSSGQASAPQASPAPVAAPVAAPAPAEPEAAPAAELPAESKAPAAPAGE